MAKQVKIDGYQFDFEENVLDAYIFDDNEYNGVRNQMKSVDVIAEFPNEYLFIELKKYSDGGIEFRCPLWDDKKLLTDNCPLSTDNKRRVPATIKKITHDLRNKYFDTFVYLFAEDKLNKPVNYICVVEGCDSALTLRLNDILLQQIPKGIPTKTKWKSPIVKNIAVVNVDGWNKKFNRYGQCSLNKEPSENLRR